MSQNNKHYSDRATSGNHQASFNREELVTSANRHVIAQATDDQGALVTNRHGTADSTYIYGLSNIQAPSTTRTSAASNSYLEQQSAMPNVAQPAVEPVRGDPDSQHLRFESTRLGTFSAGWPANCPVSPEDLAAAGLYYFGIEDVVRCAFCDGSLKQWVHGDNPMEEHRKFFPGCRFVRGEDVGNVVMPTSLARSQSFPVEFRQDVFQVQSTPLHPQYADYDMRLMTYHGSTMPPGQTPEELARAGFYFIGPEDSVMCFWCGGSLKRWVPTDRPYSEHLRWFPHCGLLKQIPLPPQQHNVQSTARPSQQPINNFLPPRNPEMVGNLGGAIQSMTLDEPMDTLTTPVSVAGIVEEGEKSSGSSQPSDEIQSRTSTASPHQPPDGKLVSLEEENQRLKSAIQCKICMDKEVNTLFLPCGHLVCCEDCAPGLRICPMCRVDIRGTIRTFIS